MLNKIKHIFLLIFFLSASSLSLQGTVLYFLKDGNAVKKQMTSNNIPVSEEEDETEKTKTEEEDLFTETNPLFLIDTNEQEVIWPEPNTNYSSNIISNHTPPPEL